MYLLDQVKKILHIHEPWKKLTSYEIIFIRQDKKRMKSMFNKTDFMRFLFFRYFFLSLI